MDFCPKPWMAVESSHPSRKAEEEGRKEKRVKKLSFLRVEGSTFNRINRTFLLSLYKTFLSSLNRTQMSDKINNK